MQTRNNTQLDIFFRNLIVKKPWAIIIVSLLGLSMIEGVISGIVWTVIIGVVIFIVRGMIKKKADNTEIYKKLPSSFRGEESKKWLSYTTLSFVILVLLMLIYLREMVLFFVLAIVTCVVVYFLSPKDKKRNTDN